MEPFAVCKLCLASGAVDRNSAQLHQPQHQDECSRYLNFVICTDEWWCQIVSAAVFSQRVYESRNRALKLRRLHEMEMLGIFNLLMDWDSKKYRIF